MTLPEGAHIVAVTALVVRDGRVLAMRRSALRDAGAGLWETPSGRVREGEEPFDAVRRELTEETGLVVELEARPFTAYPALRGTRPMIVIAYRARWLGGEVMRSDEHDAHAWWTPDEWRRGSTLTRLVAVVEHAVAEDA
jgi:8-oxo-dGTP diphosphatase